MANTFGTSNSESDQGTSVLAIRLDDTSVHLLRRVIASVPGFSFGASLQQYFGEKDATLIRTLRETHPEVCVIDLDHDRRMALETVEYLRRAALTPIAIFAASSYMDSESIIAAMRSGCTEYLDKPLVADRVQEALVQLSRKKRDLLVSSVQGKLITLMGVKGGVGEPLPLPFILAYLASRSAARRCFSSTITPSWVKLLFTLALSTTTTVSTSSHATSIAWTPSCCRASPSNMRADSMSSPRPKELA